jgi:hypothetical protein
MRERVTAIGGTLTAEPIQVGGYLGGYLVRAELPIEGGRG